MEAPFKAMIIFESEKTKRLYNVNESRFKFNSTLRIINILAQLAIKLKEKVTLTYC